MPTRAAAPVSAVSARERCPAAVFTGGGGARRVRARDMMDRSFPGDL